MIEHIELFVIFMETDSIIRDNENNDSFEMIIDENIDIQNGM